MATDGDYGATAPQTFARQLRRAEDGCKRRHDRARSAFWQFLDGLTWALLGGPFEKTSDRWGWSNLLKIGWSVGNPHQWRPPVQPILKDDQRDVCVSALRQEFENLSKSLIVICTGDTFGVLDSRDLFPKLVPHWKNSYADNWDKANNDQTGVWSLRDPKSGNLYAHCYHPRHMVQAWDSFWGSALGYIIHMARASIPPFGFGSP
jgi:hypothetical protein